MYPLETHRVWGDEVQSSSSVVVRISPQKKITSCWCCSYRGTRRRASASQRYARSGPVTFDERSHRLATFAVGPRGYSKEGRFSARPVQCLVTGRVKRGVHTPYRSLGRWKPFTDNQTGNCRLVIDTHFFVGRQVPDGYHGMV